MVYGIWSGLWYELWYESEDHFYLFEIFQTSRSLNWIVDKQILSYAQHRYDNTNVHEVNGITIVCAPRVHPYLTQVTFDSLNDKLFRFHAIDSSLSIYRMCSGPYIPSGVIGQILVRSASCDFSRGCDWLRCNHMMDVWMYGTVAPLLKKNMKAEICCEKYWLVKAFLDST